MLIDHTQAMIRRDRRAAAEARRAERNVEDENVERDDTISMDVDDRSDDGTLVGVEAPPVGVAKMLPVRCEVLRDKGPLPAVDDVRSRRRVWYANGPADVDGRGLGRGGMEFGRSVLMAGSKVVRVL